MGTATFVGADTSTQGNWIGVYGSDGYSVAGDQYLSSGYLTQRYPPYVTVTNNGTLFGNGSSTNSKGPQLPSDPTHYEAGVWFGNATVDITITDGNTHRISVYMWDFSNGGRAQTVKVLNQDAGGAVLNTQTVSGFFATPEYLTWDCSGHIAITFTVTGGANAVFNAVLFDSPLLSPSASAPFLAADTTSKGDWVSAGYGGLGLNVISDTQSYPAGVTVTVSDDLTLTSGTTANTDCPIQPSNHANHWSGGFAATTKVLRLTISTPSAMIVRLYFWNFGATSGNLRTQTRDHSLGIILDSSFGRNITYPQYMSWTVNGSVDFYIDWSVTRGPIAALFFDSVPVVGALLLGSGMDGLGRRAGFTGGISG